MRPRLLLVVLSLSLAVMSVAPAAAAPSSPKASSSSAPDRCGPTVADGTPVLLGSLVDSVTGLLKGRAASPLGLSSSCTGVRPGARVLSDTGACTFNYLFTGSDGRRYIGTAGHCILTETGSENAWAAGTGPEARDASGQRVGEFAYAVLGGARDFALVRLDPGVAANPQMCHFGGPTGVNQDLTSAPVIVQHYGQGLVLGQTVPARTGVALGLGDPDQAFVNGLALFGDSGGPVNSADGRALGVLVTVGVHLAGPDLGLVGVTRLGPQLRQAQDRTGTTFTLVTAPRL